MNQESGYIKFQVYACIYISCEYELEIVLDQNSDLCMLSHIIIYSKIKFKIKF